MIFGSGTSNLHDVMRRHAHETPPPTARDQGPRRSSCGGPARRERRRCSGSPIPDARWVDLLKSDEFPAVLGQPRASCGREIEADGPDPARQVVIDEVQKVPALLDEVHWLMENRGLSFALCGSSARKVRRGAANLLGGRAVRLELRGLAAGELGDDFDLPRMLNHGYLPRIYGASRPRRLLDAYVADYLREEIAAEGLVRNLPAFSGFLDAAALSDGEAVNVSNIARECGVSSPTAKSYFGILEDTLLGRWLPAYRRRRKRRLAAAPKFLLRGCRRREPSRPQRRGSARVRALRQGVRELGPPRAVPHSSATARSTTSCRTGASQAASRSTSCSATCGLRSTRRRAPG